MNVAFMLSIVLAAVLNDLLFRTVANVSSETVVATESKLNVPDPSVTRACPAVPSDVGRLNVVPPDLIIILDPSDLIDSLVSTN